MVYGNGIRYTTGVSPRLEVLAKADIAIAIATSYKYSMSTVTICNGSKNATAADKCTKSKSNK